MNLWHDVAPHRVRPEDFLAVIEIENLPLRGRHRAQSI